MALKSTSQNITRMDPRSESGPGQSEKQHTSLPPSGYAPCYNVPNKLVVSVEHPYIIKNVDKGLDTLGDAKKLQSLVSDNGDTIASLYLRPGDRMSKPLKSVNVRTNNVLLKVTVPKRTGLKRKRGSKGSCYESIEEDGSASQTGLQPAPLIKASQYLLRSVRDCPKDYQVQPMGTISNTHRFRGMPDFVYSTANSPFMQKMKEHILPFEYEKLKPFKLDMSKGVKENTEIIPPPSLSHLTYPFNYSYRQNPSVKQVVDELGNATTVNIHSAPKTWNQPVPFDVDTVPAGPSPDIPPEESQILPMKRLIASARRLMEERPIFTRRALMNSISGDDWETVGQNVAKHVYQYVGYMFQSGPWRDAVVRFSVDPRKDPECRKYQTMMFMLEKEPKDNRARFIRTKPDRTVTPQVAKKESHLFDGQNVSKDGKVWQVCDVTDPFLKDLLATEDIRQECHIESDGWYLNGTWAKAKVIMKYKLRAILDGVPADEAAFARVAREMPDTIEKNDKATSRLGKDATSEEVRIASEIRAGSFVYRMPGSETVGQEEGYVDEEVQDGEMVMPEGAGQGVVDPRLAEAGLELDRLQRDGRTREVAEMVDEMDIDADPASQLP